jgi:hypothetical protein
MDAIRDIVAATLGRPIAFQPVFARVCGSINAGLMLSQAYYWTPRTSDPRGWFYKTQSEWKEETYLTRYEQETARRILKAKGFLQEHLRGNPAQLFYRVDFEALVRAISQLAENQQSRLRESRKQECRRPAIKSAVIPQTLNKTESTTETTTESSIAPLLRKQQVEGVFPEVNQESNGSDYTRFMQIWNDHSGRLPKIRELTKKRADKLRARVRGKPTFQEEFAEAVQKAAKTPFLLGENDHGWSADFDWMIKDDTNYIRVLEGKYDGQSRGNRRSGGAYHSEDPSRSYDRPPDLVVVS